MLVWVVLSWSLFSYRRDRESLASMLLLAFVCTFLLGVGEAVPQPLTRVSPRHVRNQGPPQSRRGLSSRSASPKRSRSTGGRRSRLWASQLTPSRNAFARSVSGQTRRRRSQKAEEWFGWTAWASSCATTASRTQRGIRRSAAFSRIARVLGLCCPNAPSGWSRTRPGPRRSAPGSARRPCAPARARPIPR